MDKTSQSNLPILVLMIFKLTMIKTTMMINLERTLRSIEMADRENPHIKDMVRFTTTTTTHSILLN